MRNLITNLVCLPCLIEIRKISGVDCFHALPQCLAGISHLEYHIIKNGPGYENRGEYEAPALETLLKQGFPVLKGK